MLATPDRRDLLALARASIDAALSHGQLVPFTPALLSAALKVQRSSFVTLHRGAELRGCCGTIDAPRPLAEDVWRNAWASAFNDYRFPPVTAAEWPHMHVHVSVLTPPELLPVATEAQLLTALRPGVDGLILESQGGRATFLPSVWEQIANPADFVQQLKKKAGWPASYWSSQMRAYRYTAEGFGDELPAD
jgi:uncharacterized protein